MVGEGVITAVRFEVMEDSDDLTVATEGIINQQGVNKQYFTDGFGSSVFFMIDHLFAKTVSRPSFDYFRILFFRNGAD